MELIGGHLGDLSRPPGAMLEPSKAISAEKCDRSDHADGGCDDKYGNGDGIDVDGDDDGLTTFRARPSLC